MGLDSVEIVLQCEERFGIIIDDEEAQVCTTVGSLQDLVAAKCATSSVAACLSQHTFYRLRRTLLRHAGPRKSFLKPETELVHLLPSERLPQEWAALEAAADLTLPSLAWPGWAARICLLAFLAVPGAAVLGAADLMSPAAAWALAGASVLTLALLGSLGTSLATRLPADLPTVRDLVGRVVSLNIADLADRLGAMPDHDVRAAVADVIAEVLGVEKHRVVPDAEFVRDLGLA